MDGEDRNPAADLIAELARDGYDASFFQVVRRLNQMAAQLEGRARLGASAQPSQEMVRLKVARGMRHVANEILQARVNEAEQAELTVAFMGLTGPTGVLPDYYTEVLIAQSQARQTAAANFFDIFNHRTLSHFYRAWAKHQLTVSYEQAERPLSDPFSRALAATIGLGLESARPTLEADGGDLLSVAGAFARRARTPGALRQALAALYDMPVTVLELQGRWVDIAPEEQTALGDGRFNVLGGEAVLGARTWDVQGRFRVRMGPMGLEAFLAFFEEGGLRESLIDTIRLAVGATADFDIQLILDRRETPSARLGDHLRPTLLGKTSWILSQPAEQDRDDAVVSARWRPLHKPKTNAPRKRSRAKVTTP